MHPTQIFCEIRVVKKFKGNLISNGFGPIVYYYVDGNNFYVLYQRMVNKVNTYYTPPIVQKINDKNVSA